MFSTEVKEISQTWAPEQPLGRAGMYPAAAEGNQALWQHWQSTHMGTDPPSGSIPGASGEEAKSPSTKDCGPTVQQSPVRSPPIIISPSLSRLI